MLFSRYGEENSTASIVFPALAYIYLDEVRVSQAQSLTVFSLHFCHMRDTLAFFLCAKNSQQCTLGIFSYTQLSLS